jgi:hypothetical protein
MKELLGRQAQLNSALDLDKHETQRAPPEESDTGLRLRFAKLPQSLRGSNGFPRRA